MIVHLIGFAASCMAFVLFIPQAVRVWHLRADAHGLLGVSVWTQVALLTNACLWGLYAALTEAFWVGAPGLVNAPLALAVLMLIYRARTTSSGQCLVCGFAEGEHLIFVTSPPGYGSQMPCSKETVPHGVPMTPGEALRRRREELELPT